MTSSTDGTDINDESNKPPKRDRRSRARAKFPLDPQCLAILDAEIVKQATTGHMLALSQRQVLPLLLKRGYACTCGADARPLPTLTVPPDAQARVVDIDRLSRSVLTAAIDKVGEAKQVRLHRYQILRLLLLRAARCTCPPKPFDAAT